MKNLKITSVFSYIGSMTVSGSGSFRGKPSREMALDKLKRYCAYQKRSQGEVRQKLFSMGFSKTEVGEMVSVLIELGYVNEERFALHFASGKSRIKGWGAQKIRNELRSKGISEYCIEKTLKSLDQDEYKSVFQRLAGKKWQSLHKEKNIFVKKNKWRRWLLQKGYDAALINSWSPQE